MTRMLARMTFMGMWTCQVMGVFFSGTALAQPELHVVPDPGSAIRGARSSVHVPGSATIPGSNFDDWGGRYPYFPTTRMPYPPYMVPYFGLPFSYWPPLNHSYYQHGLGMTNVVRAGHIQLVVDPVDAKVFIDGYKVMQRPDLSYTVNLLEGRHRLQVLHEGFKPYDQPLDVPGGGGFALGVRLEK